MLLTTFHIIRFHDEGDDIIKIFQGPVPDLYEVRYHTSDGRNLPETRGYMTRTRVVDYVRTLLNALPEDVEPFYRFQISSNLHPSIMYEIPDLSDEDNKNTILNMVDQVLSSHLQRHSS